MNTNELQERVQKAVADAMGRLAKITKSANVASDHGGSVAIDPKLAAALFEAGRQAGRTERRNGGQRSLDRGDIYTPGSGIDVAVQAPDAVLGDRAAQAFRQRNAHAIRTGGLNRAMESQGSAGDGRLPVSKEEKSANDALARSSLRATSGAAIAKKIDAKDLDTRVMNAVLAGGRKGVSPDLISAGLGVGLKDVQDALSRLAAEGTIKIAR